VVAGRGNIPRPAAADCIAAAACRAAGRDLPAAVLGVGEALWICLSHLPFHMPPTTLIGVRPKPCVLSASNVPFVSLNPRIDARRGRESCVPPAPLSLTGLDAFRLNYPCIYLLPVAIF
jgi:hypothetical protein